MPLKSTYILFLPEFRRGNLSQTRDHIVPHGEALLHPCGHVSAKPLDFLCTSVKVARVCLLQRAEKRFVKMKNRLTNTFFWGDTSYISTQHTQTAKESVQDNQARHQGVDNRALGIATRPKLIAR